MNPITGSCCFLEQETSASLLSTKNRFVCIYIGRIAYFTTKVNEKYMNYKGMQYSGALHELIEFILSRNILAVILIYMNKIACILT